MGHEVTVLAHAARAGEAQVLPQAVTGSPSVHVELVARDGMERLHCRSGRKRLRTLVPAVDFVHIHGVWTPIGWAAGSCALDSGTAYCIAPHGMLDPWSLHHKGVFKRLKKQIALAITLRRQLDNASFLHVLNADEQRLLTPLGLGAPAAVVPNGISFDEIDPIPHVGAFHERCPELRGRPYVLFLSRLHPKKGADILADAFAKVAAKNDGVDVVFAGPDGGAVGPLRRQLERLGLASRAHFVGSLHGRDKVAAFAGCACFCLPSRQEGFSMAILEAMACRRPVVITEACHFPEVSSAGAGVVVQGEGDAIVSALAGAMDAVLSSSERARGMGEAGRRLVEDRFTWDAAAALCVDAYNRFKAR